jgi:FkbM family methyltransferase
MDSSLYEERLCHSYLRPGDTVIDVGANIGLYTNMLSKCVGEEGRVFAFEPDPIAFGSLIRNCNNNVCAQQFAVGSNQGLNRWLYRSSNGNNGDHRTWNDFSEIRESIVVREITLDCVISGTVNLIKIDVQGTEVDVLKGAKNLINYQPNLAILIEFWPRGLRGAGKSSSEFITTIQNELQMRIYEPIMIKNKPMLKYHKNGEELKRLYDSGDKCCNLWCVKGELVRK